jgi:hypothetical protein
MKTLSLKGLTVFITSILLVALNVSWGSGSPAQASGSLTVQMGKTLTFTAAQALSPSQLSTYSSSCNATGYSMQIAATGSAEILFEAYGTFETEHCLNQASHWVDVFRWENTACTSNVTACLGMPSNTLMASAGEYEITFELAMAGQSPTLLTNVIPLTVLPSFFYKFSEKNSEVFPYKDKIRDSVVGSMEFWNETGIYLQEFPKAKLALKQGKKLIASTYLELDGSFVFELSKPIKGEYEVSVSSIPNPPGGKKWVLAGPNLQVVTRETKISNLSLSAPKEVFPSKDGYLDTASISVSSALTTGKRGKLTGKITILNGTKVVKTFPLSMSGATSLKWDGKVSGRIVPGAYKIVANVKGPEGGTIRKEAVVKVSAKKLVSTTISKTYGAYAAADEDQGDSYEPIERYGSSGARFYSSGDGDFMVVKLSLPINSKTTKWRIRFNNWETGNGIFRYTPCRTSNCLTSYVSTNNLWFTQYDSGSSWSPWANLPGNVANFSIVSTSYASLYVESFTIEYVTTVLK